MDDSKAKSDPLLQADQSSRGIVAHSTGSHELDQYPDLGRALIDTRHVHLSDFYNYSGRDSRIFLVQPPVDDTPVANNNTGQLGRPAFCQGFKLFS